MKSIASSIVAAALAAALAGCGQSSPPGGAPAGNAGGDAHGGGTHTHADGTVHADDAHAPAAPDLAPPPFSHAHDEVALGPATIGAMTVELAQGHGAVAAGKEGHLVVRLPYSDRGATVVRAWVGTQDRTLSHVGKGTYTAASGAYDVHAVAPDPLPDGAMWWIEIEKPDGSKVVGSAKPNTN